jgi:hypothetical protein
MITQTFGDWPHDFIVGSIRGKHAHINNCSVSYILVVLMNTRARTPIAAAVHSWYSLAITLYARYLRFCFVSMLVFSGVCYAQFCLVLLVQLCVCSASMTSVYVFIGTVGVFFHSNSKFCPSTNGTILLSLLYFRCLNLKMILGNSLVQPTSIGWLLFVFVS